MLARLGVYKDKALVVSPCVGHHYKGIDITINGGSSISVELTKEQEFNYRKMFYIVGWHVSANHVPHPLFRHYITKIKFFNFNNII